MKGLLVLFLDNLIPLKGVDKDVNYKAAEVLKQRII